MADTPTKLLQGALDTLRAQGIAGASARSIAAAAGVNQALVFYHFGTVDELLAAACRHGAEQQVARYRARFASVTSLRELLDVGRALRAEKEAAVDFAVLAQLLAGAQTDAGLSTATADGLRHWVAEIETVLVRVLGDSPLAEFLDFGGLSRAVAAAFIGLQLYDGVDPAGADGALAALEQLAVLATVFEDLGPVARRTALSRLRRARG